MTTDLNVPLHQKAQAKPQGARRVGLIVVFFWFAIGGIAHFAVTDLETSIVPPYVPRPRDVVLITGVLELLGAAGLLWPRLRRLAGLGLFVLTLAVTPAHIYMLQHPELFRIPYWALVLRVPLQAALLCVIAVSTNAFGERRPKRIFG